MLGHAILAFDRHPAVDYIVIVAAEAEMADVSAECADFHKVTGIVAGGPTRAASVRNGLETLPPDTQIVLVHDAARPLVTKGIIDDVIEGARIYGAAVPGYAVSDTLKRMDENGIVQATIPRVDASDHLAATVLTAVQTPQGARIALLREAYARFDFNSHFPTDEAGLLEAAGFPVRIVDGGQTNIKITRPRDVATAIALLSSRPSVSDADSSMHPASGQDSHQIKDSILREVRTGFGYDVHAFASPAAGRKLYLGGVEIPHDRGLDGHSDADVLLHAVCDALLGALSLGDIGILFPNTDPAYKDISSLRLLEVVRERVTTEGWRVVNVDATLVAEAPRVMPHRLTIQQKIATCLEIDASRVSVKATTSEQMGFVGRGEGMACWAVATVTTSI